MYVYIYMYVREEDDDEERRINNPKIIFTKTKQNKRKNALT